MTEQAINWGGAKLMSIKHILFIVAALTSFVWAWSQGLAWIVAGGNLLNLPSFFIASYRSGPAAGFLTIDILFVWITYIVWVIGDAGRIGLGTKWGVVFALLSFLGTCLSFPLYLVVRERTLDAEPAR